MPGQHILLACWDFPPNSGIGGRRWAKFAKGLVKEGYKIHIIKSKAAPGNQASAWFKDVDHASIHVHELKPYWAVNWLHNYTSFLHPLRIRIAQLWLGAIFKGTIYDKAIGLQQKYTALAASVIKKHGIKNVIVTGAPFNLLYYTALLKRQLPDLNIIADYRDPWLNSVNYGMTALAEKRKQEEMEKQDVVFESVTTITAPNAYLIRQIRETYKGTSTAVKFIELPHVYDPDDVVSQPEKSKAEKSLRLVYAGALYTDSDPFLEKLANALIYFKQQFPGIKIELDIYTSHSTSVFSNKGLQKEVKILSPVGDKIFELIAGYDLMLILLSHHNKDFKTTKFIEFLPYKIPYLYAGPHGFVSESITSEALGYVLSESSDLASLYDQLQSPQALKGFESIDAHALENVTKKIINCFT